MQDFIDKKIVLGVSGGISAYKAAELARLLIKRGAEVRVVMSESAQQFISPMTFQALTGNPVDTHLFQGGIENAMTHITLARWADYFLVAPASANLLARFSQGLASDLLSTIYLATKASVILCPAMNRMMWEHPATIENVKRLTSQGVMVVEPEVGEQACGEEGAGRLPTLETIMNALRLHDIQGTLSGKRVLVTAGPTVESIDPVRYLSNHSSGKMGFALAEAAYIAGAEVTLISGPVQLVPRAGIHFISVKSVKEMQEAVVDALTPHGIFISAAAVSDYQLEKQFPYKLKKNNVSMTLTLEPAPDILKTVSLCGMPQYLVGFAAETCHLMEHAQQKYRDKKLHMMIANQVGDGLGFGVEGNEVVVLTEHETTKLPFTHKVRLAGQIIAILSRSIQNTPCFLKREKECHDS